jgi:hypothetical protein
VLELELEPLLLDDKLELELLELELLLLLDVAGLLLLDEELELLDSLELDPLDGELLEDGELLLLLLSISTPKTPILYAARSVALVFWILSVSLPALIA